MSISIYLEKIDADTVENGPNFANTIVIVNFLARFGNVCPTNCVVLTAQADLPSPYLYVIMKIERIHVFS